VGAPHHRLRDPAAQTVSALSVTSQQLLADATRPAAYLPRLARLVAQTTVITLRPNAIERMVNVDVERGGYPVEGTRLAGVGESVQAPPRSRAGDYSTGRSQRGAAAGAAVDHHADGALALVWSQAPPHDSLGAGVMDPDQRC
jgi:hypothetical protein